MLLYIIPEYKLDAIPSWLTASKLQTKEPTVKFSIPNILNLAAHFPKISKSLYLCNNLMMQIKLDFPYLTGKTREKDWVSYLG